MSTPSRRARRTWFGAVAAVLASPVSAPRASTPPASSPSPSTEPLPVVLDYSPTLSDATALVYLASNPAVDLLAVTLPGTGEADCEPGVRITRSLLTVAGREDVPVACGANAPLSGDRDWPEEWRSEVNRWGTDILPAVDPMPVGDAAQLLIDTLTRASAPVTLIAVAPLTNLGTVLPDHPELVARVERVVIMGGAVTVPGNVEDSPAAEWNIYIDPEAARRVLDAGVPVTFVPLDATNHMPWTERLLSRLGALDGRVARTVHEIALSRPSLDGFYLWDELAVMAAVDPTLVTTQPMTVRVDDNGATIADPSGVSVTVAIDTDAAAAADELLRVLNGGESAEVVPLTAEELAYMTRMATFDSQANARFARVFDLATRNSRDPHLAARTFVDGLVDSMDALVADLNTVTPPPALQDAHAAYVEILSTFSGSRARMLAALDKATGRNFEELVNAAAVELGTQDLFARVALACRVLQDYSFLHDGPRPCSSAVGQ